MGDTRLTGATEVTYYATLAVPVYKGDAPDESKLMGNRPRNQFFTRGRLYCLQRDANV